jgi:hypothetical protein
MTQSQGAGHDYGIGLLHDLSGDDRYECPGAAMGLGIWNGIGIVLDAAGDDVYVGSATSLGRAAESRPEHLCLGLFLDLGGRDTFPTGHPARPRSCWVQPPAADRPRAHGVGLAR